MFAQVTRFAAVLLLALNAPSLFAQQVDADAMLSTDEPLSGKAIMDKVNDVDMGDSVVSDVEMIVIDNRGNEKPSSLKSYRKKFGEDLDETRSIMFYTFPRAFKGIGFLSIDFDDASQSDRRWLYTPAFQKTKKIASKDKRLSFMSSDFSYADMNLQNFKDYNFKLVGEEELNGHKVWVINSTPVDEKGVLENGYTKSVFYVRQDNYMVVKSINHLKKGNKVKEMNITNVEQIDGYWVPTEIIMETSKSGTTLSKTIMRTTNVQFGFEFPNAKKFFSTRQLQRGPI